MASRAMTFSLSRARPFWSITYKTTGWGNVCKLNHACFSNWATTGRDPSVGSPLTLWPLFRLRFLQPQMPSVRAGAEEIRNLSGNTVAMQCSENGVKRAVRHIGAFT